jgi:hypothetical protein
LAAVGFTSNSGAGIKPDIFYFERSHIDLQDAVFSWRASYCLGKMLLRVLMGKYRDDIQERKAILQNYQSTTLLE